MIARRITELRVYPLLCGPYTRSMPISRAREFWPISDARCAQTLTAVKTRLCVISRNILIKVGWNLHFVLSITRKDLVFSLPLQLLLIKTWSIYSTMAERVLNFAAGPAKLPEEVSEVYSPNFLYLFHFLWSGFPLYLVHLFFLEFAPHRLSRLVISRDSTLAMRCKWILF